MSDFNNDKTEKEIAEVLQKSKQLDPQFQNRPFANLRELMKSGQGKKK